MPIECSVDVGVLGQENFHAVDKIVMRHAFDIHNSLGCLCDERIYQDELAIRCGQAGLRCLREVELRARHQAFTKSYYLDLLVDQGAIYELKSVESLANTHQNQLINYLLLTGSHHGKLINFRASSVESRFVSTRLNHTDRLSFDVSELEWKRCDENAPLRSALIGLLEDWGTFLDIRLYREALLHLLEGPDAGLQPVAIQIEGRAVGFQKMCLLSPEHAWHLTSMKIKLRSHETHIKRLMQRTPLKFIHWINLNQNQIILKSLRK